MTGSRFVWVSI